jgi:hypothetical protein
VAPPGGFFALARPPCCYPGGVPDDIAALRIELAAREGDAQQFDAGIMTMLEDGTLITAEMVQQWREEIAELRRLTQGPERRLNIFEPSRPELHQGGPHSH